MPVSQLTQKNGNGELGHGGASGPERMLRLKQELHQQLIQSMDLSAVGTLSEEELRREVRRAAEELCHLTPGLLSLSERERLVQEVLDETFGLGPLEPLMKDPAICDILINGAKTVYVERAGRLERTPVAFIDEQHLVRIIQRVVGRVGRRVDETSPMVDARLSDGSRFNAIIAPLALDGAMVSIRRFGTKPLKMADLVAKSAIMPPMVQFLEACTKARCNMIVSGGTGSGKTTLLNSLSAYIPDDQRVVTIEDAAELRLQQSHVCRLETRPASTEGSGEVTTRDLVKNALRMRPDRIVIGECRGPEALDMLQAMNTGHEGSLTTIHANDTREALSRLEMMVGMAGFDMPMWIIRRQIASAVHIIVQAARLPGGARKVMKISEVTGMEGDVVSMHDIFLFKQTGVDNLGNARGEFRATGIRPRCMERLEAAGIRLATELFEQRILRL
jgi:pilus assembly protein CpaF